jgi:hypothetical protein
VSAVKHFLFYGLISIFLVPCCCAQVSPSLADNRTLPFELRNGFLIVVHGSIGDFKDLNFLLDTGSTHTVVDRRIAAKIGSHQRSGHVFTFHRYTSVEWSTFPDISFGPVITSQATLMVADLSGVSELADGIDAIIGLDLLRLNSRLLIDYDRRTVTFFKSFNSSYEKDPDCLTVQIRIQNQPVRLIVDKGLQGILLYEAKIRERFSTLHTEHKRAGYIGSLHVKLAEVPGIALGAQSEETTVSFVDQRLDNPMVGIDGYLGLDTLKARKIEFDFDSNALRWQR